MTRTCWFASHDSLTNTRSSERPRNQANRPYSTIWERFSEILSELIKSEGTYPEYRVVHDLRGPIDSVAGFYYEPTKS